MSTSDAGLVCEKKGTVTSRTFKILLGPDFMKQVSATRKNKKIFRESVHRRFLSTKVNMFCFIK